MNEVYLCQLTMSRYSERMELAEKLWQKERAKQIAVEGAGP